MTLAVDTNYNDAIDDFNGDRTNVKQLPADVLIEVFMFSTTTYVRPFANTSPLVLSQVCREWRAIVIATPNLWTYLQLKVIHLDLLQSFEVLRLWISRVKNHPLVVDVAFLEDPTTNKPLNALKQVNSLIDTVLSLSSTSLVDNRLSAAVVDPRLTRDGEAAVEMYTWAPPDARPDRLPQGSVMINVTRCVNIVYGLEGHEQLSKWLTVVDLADADGLFELSPEECHIILSNFPLLEKCALRVGQAPSPLVATSHLMLNLKILSLFWTDIFYASSVIESIFAPNLEYLELDGPTRHPYFTENVGHFQPEVMRFLERSRPPLHVLEFSKMDLGGIDIMSCLALTTDLYTLMLEDCTMDQTYLDFCLQNRHPHHEDARRTIMDLDMVHLVSCIFNGFVDWISRLLAADDAMGQIKWSDLRIYDCGRFSQEILLDFEKWTQMRFTVSPIGPDYTVFL